MSKMEFRHAVLYWDYMRQSWRVSVLVDCERAEEEARRWVKTLLKENPKGKIMICRLVKTIECN